LRAFAIHPDCNRNSRSGSYTTEAQALFEQGKLLQAIDVYRDAIALDQTIRPCTWPARVLVFAGRHAEAQDAAGDAMLLDPDHPMAHGPGLGA
jgi:tetratricopeptide (TPR) repeat protein